MRAEISLLLSTRCHHGDGHERFPPWEPPWGAPTTSGISRLRRVAMSSRSSLLGSSMAGWYLRGRLGLWFLVLAAITQGLTEQYVDLSLQWRQLKCRYAGLSCALAAVPACMMLEDVGRMAQPALGPNSNVSVISWNCSTSLVCPWRIFTANFRA